MRPRRVIEELCMDDACPREESHWHPFTMQSLFAAKDGEYTLTLRVRTAQDPRTQSERVVRCLGTAARLGAQEIADCEGIAVDVVHTLLSKLTARGIVRRVDRGQYALCKPRSSKR